MSTLTQRLLAEGLGSFFLVVSVLGAGRMVDVLNAGDALGLLMIAVCVGAVLVVAIAALGPVSGAHFNPVVSLVMVLRGQLPLREAPLYIAVQVLGAVGGALTANVMFGAQAFAVSSVKRGSAGVWLGEAVATFGLVVVIVLLVDHHRGQWIPAGVGLWIVAGHLFTSSTSFANPAVTVGRMFSDASNGISPESGLWFIPFQIVGGLLAWGVGQALRPRAQTGSTSDDGGDGGGPEGHSKLTHKPD